MRAIEKYPDEVKEYVIKNAPGRTIYELVDGLNQEFSEKLGVTFTKGKVQAFKKNHHIHGGKRNVRELNSKFPVGMKDYIRSIASGRSSTEIAKMTSEHFGIEFSASQCISYKKNHKISSGYDCKYKKGHVPYYKGKGMPLEVYEKCKKGMFKKGNVPFNQMKIGEYTHTTDGYLIRKICMTGNFYKRFEFVHRAVWEEHNGPIPKGMVVTFLDGNKDNCDISNLTLMDNAEMLELNRSHLRSSDPEITQAAATLAKLNVAIRRKQRD